MFGLRDYNVLALLGETAGDIKTAGRCIDTQAHSMIAILETQGAHIGAGLSIAFRSECV